MTYKQLLKSGYTFDASGITNPHAFQWEPYGPEGIYYPKDFRVMMTFVYRSGSDCTNGGVSATNDHLYVAHPEGPSWASKVDQSLIMFPEHRMDDYWALYPAYRPDHLVGPMAGGNLAYSSDSRMRTVYHIHDRFETQGSYDILSQ